MTHELKILPQYFLAVKNGEKKAELRKDDRDYKVGDVLLLCEWGGTRYTGQTLSVTVTHILRNCAAYGLADGYCILSIGNPRLDKQGEAPESKMEKDFKAYIAGQIRRENGVYACMYCKNRREGDFAGCDHEDCDGVTMWEYGEPEEAEE